MQGKFWTIASPMILCIGCAVGPKYDPPYFEMPCEWHSHTSPGMKSDSPDCSWWKALNDSQLNCLIERAASQNLDMVIAGTRILEARAQQKDGSAYLYPHLDASAACGHAQYSQKTLDRILGLDAKHHKGNSLQNLNFFEVGFDAEWEIDLFGVNGHELKALIATTQASEASFIDLWVTLSAEIAKNYVELRGLQQQLQIIRNNIDAQTHTYQLLQDLSSTGFTGSIEQHQAKEQLESLCAQQPQIELAINKAIHRLSLLVGLQPATLYDELNKPHELPSLPYCKPIGLPSELLRRRPDIRKAERELAAATERVDSAIAALFPRFSLRGFIGDIGAFCTGSYTSFAESQLLLPIFNSKLLEQDVEINKIRAKQAFYEYQKKVMESLEEAENAIASFHSELERHECLQRAKAASQESYELSLQLYHKGFKDYLSVLLANRAFLSAEQALLQSQVDLLLNYIALYKALGGGWDIECATH